MLAGTFLFSSVMNYLLARWVVTSPAGTEAFNNELGRMTLLSYPVIAIPSMLMMMGVMFYLARGATPAHRAGAGADAQTSAPKA